MVKYLLDFVVELQLGYGGIDNWIILGPPLMVK
jgi:hypothetical protein